LLLSDETSVEKKQSLQNAQSFLDDLICSQYRITDGNMKRKQASLVEEPSEEDLLEELKLLKAEVNAQEERKLKNHILNKGTFTNKEEEEDIEELVKWAS